QQTRLTQRLVRRTAVGNPCRRLVRREACCGLAARAKMRETPERCAFPPHPESPEGAGGSAARRRSSSPPTIPEEPMSVRPAIAFARIAAPKKGTAVVLVAEGG